MDKWAGLKIGEYEIVNEINNDEEYKYEEVLVEELLNRNNYTQEMKNGFLRKYFAINIHKLLCEETYQSCLDLIDKAKSDPRLKNLNAIVFLALKPKGRGTHFTSLQDPEKYRTLAEKAMEANVGIGFDSCSANMFLTAMKNSKNYESFQQLAESCESGIFSSYFDVDGNYWPCSFCENVYKTHDGKVDIKPINAFECTDFLKDIWYAPQTVEWRKNLISTCGENKCRKCPVYNIDSFEVNKEEVEASL